MGAIAVSVFVSVVAIVGYMVKRIKELDKYATI